MSSQKKVSSLTENVKYDWTAPVLAPPMTLAGVGGGGGGLFEMEQRGPSSKHTVSTLAVSLPWRYISLIFFIKSLKQAYSCVRLERSSDETNDRAPRTFKKKPRFLRKKKGKRKLKKKKRERPFALTESYCFLHCYWKSEKEQSYTRSPRGGTRWIYHIPHRSRYITFT